MFKIGNVEIKNSLIVGPMAGITNGAFREICYEFGASLTCSEMISDKAIFYNNKKTWEMLEVDDKYHPVSLQLFGSDINTMISSAKVMDEKTNCDIIDINMGCPVNKVIKTGAGSAMMKDEDKSVEIIKGIIENVKKPVTVKMRLGYDNKHMNYLSLSKKLEEVGVKAITLHGRTRTQMYEGKSDWSHIKKLKEELNIPVIGNGDILSVEDFKNQLEYSKVDAIMISRGIVGNPSLIKEINNFIDGKEDYKISYHERLDACKKHALKLIDLKGEKVAIREMRSLGPHYLSGLYMATKYKNEINRINTYEDLENILNNYEELLNQN